MSERERTSAPSRIAGFGTAHPIGSHARKETRTRDFRVGARRCRLEGRAVLRPWNLSRVGFPPVALFYDFVPPCTCDLPGLVWRVAAHSLGKGSIDGNCSEAHAFFWSDDRHRGRSS